MTTAQMTGAEVRSQDHEEIVYDDGITRAYVIATIVWGIVALALGALVASQLTWFQMSFGQEWLSFGRLRPLHTNAAIFAFVGNMMFAGICYSTQRLVKQRLASSFLSWFSFWGWQLIIVGAALTLPLGMTQGKEYAELIWPIDIAIALVWVTFSVNFFWTLARRNEPNLYVALWFYIATFVTIAVLHIVRNLVIPTGFFHSYPVYAGVQEALVQWWYGHNAVGFFLTTPILGIMYYFIPKAAGRPVYSYRLSIVHFWALIFVYIWAGPHHLLNTSLPEWAQTLGMVFSLMLWAPSWGGMLNGLLTLRGAWDKLRTDPVIKFFVVSITFYGMSTFEGPLLSIKSVNGLAHYTDWIIAHVHAGALGWNGFMAAGMLYWLVPRLWNVPLKSVRMAEAHFWVATFGILFYVVAMWTSGINSGLYWRALNAEGFLKYPDFVEGLIATRMLYHLRLLGGLLYLGGFVLMAVNLFATMAAGAPVNGTVKVPRAVAAVAPARSSWGLLKGAPVLLSILGMFVLVALGLATPLTAAVVIALTLGFAALTYLFVSRDTPVSESWHRLLEGRSLVFTVLVLFAILLGGLAELIPTVVIEKEVPMVATVVTNDQGEPEKSYIPITESKWTQLPYSPLELEGRDIYVREGCYNCHSQMVRPFRFETLRYGEYTRLEESIYDHPFQFGSKRTGPDLQRVGGRYPNLWHYQHMMDPRSTSPGSNMPLFAFLRDRTVNLSKTPTKISVMKTLGVPYTETDVTSAGEVALSQGQLIAADLEEQGVTLAPDSEMAAIIAYLQRIGRGPQPTGPTVTTADAGTAVSGVGTTTGGTVTTTGGAGPTTATVR